jgi:hypothetical protein
VYSASCSSQNAAFKLRVSKPTLFLSGWSSPVGVTMTVLTSEDVKLMSVGLSLLLTVSTYPLEYVRVGVVL